MERVDIMKTVSVLLVILTAQLVQVTIGVTRALQILSLFSNLSKALLLINAIFVLNPLTNKTSTNAAHVLTTVSAAPTTPLVILVKLDMNLMKSQ